MSRLSEFSDELESLVQSSAPSVVAVEHGHGQGSGIPAHTAAWVTAILIRDGRIERPLLGISAQGIDVAPRVAEEIGQQRAVRVQGVANDSPASAASIKPADLLLSANDSPLYSVDDLQRVLVLSRGSDVSLRLRRDGRALSLSVTPQLKRKAA